MHFSTEEAQYLILSASPLLGSIDQSAQESSMVPKQGIKRDHSDRATCNFFTALSAVSFNNNLLDHGGITD